MLGTILEHCWHKTSFVDGGFIRDYDGEVCCFCGKEWSKHRRVPRTGHGKFDPQKVAPDKPIGPCPGRQAVPHV